MPNGHDVGVTPRHDPADASGPGTERLLSGPFIAMTASAFVFFFYIGMLLVAVPRFIEDDLGEGEFGIGLGLASFGLAAVVARPFLGRLTDRFGRRALMMSGAVLASVASLAMAAASNLWHVLVLRAVMGVGEAALFVAAAILLADLAPPHRRAEAVSYFSVAVYSGTGLGPSLGEWVLGDDRFGRTFVVGGVLAALAAVTVLGVPRRVDRRVAHPAGERLPPLFHPVALVPGLVLACGIAAFAVFTAFLPDHARTVGLGGSAGLFLCYSLVSLVLRLVGATLPQRLGERFMVTVALSCLSLALALMAAVAEPWALWGSAVLAGAGMAFMYPSLMAHVVNGVDETQRASALGSFTMFFEIGTTVGGLALGGLGDLFGKRVGFLGGAVIAAGGLILLRRIFGRGPGAADARTGQEEPVANYPRQA